MLHIFILFVLKGAKPANQHLW